MHYLNSPCYVPVLSAIVLSSPPATSDLDAPDAVVSWKECDLPVGFPLPPADAAAPSADAWPTTDEADPGLVPSRRRPFWTSPSDTEEPTLPTPTPPPTRADEEPRTRSPWRLL